MFVSRKYLALIHFIARETATRLHIAEPAHQSVESGAAAGTSRVLLKPLSKCGIQGLILGLGHQPGLFDQGFVSAQGDVLHTKIVYTIFVYTAILIARKAELAL